MLSNIITNVRRALDNTARYYRGGVADEKIFSTLILTYHQIGREAYSDYPSLYVSARNFLLHMRVLKLLGYSSFYVYELIDYWKKGKPLPLVHLSLPLTTVSAVSTNSPIRYCAAIISRLRCS